MSQAKRNRFQFFLGHLAISVAAVSILLILVKLLWYPKFLFWTEGAYFAFATLVAVDVVLGPALTLVVARPDKAKRELLTDLSLIGLFQISAFGYGAYVLYTERPLMLVVAERFESKNKAFFDAADITMAVFDDFPGKAPYYVGLRPAQTNEERAQFIQNMLAGQPTASTKLYAPFQENFATVKVDNALELDSLWRDLPHLKAPMETFASKHQGTQLVWFGFKGAMHNGLLAFDTDAQFVGFVSSDEAPSSIKGRPQPTPVPAPNVGAPPTLTTPESGN